MHLSQDDDPCITELAAYFKALVEPMSSDSCGQLHETAIEIAMAFLHVILWQQDS